MGDRLDVPALLWRAATALEIRDVERERADDYEYLRDLARRVQRWQEAEAELHSARTLRFPTMRAVIAMRDAEVAMHARLRGEGCARQIHHTEARP